ncbi:MULTISPECIES: hypothetical protein [unclassified Streptomyces]|uniref:hypothetical protein n=1 Tax=unclassified Streptomyces TaxID=2593676 RepID=UPI00081E0765|nr:hypothetical protein [Streptomyces sp. ScaeMP-e83]MYR93272.1 hypothetical protein [Streptomyces sp. SID4937]SCD49724.1 hypothetical protein GA0115243_10242 [Streptomyces sp. ScaeMP-e83]
MLQCTAFAEVPEMGTLVVLTAMNAEPGQASDVPAVPGVPELPELDDILLCELGEHDEKTEHAAQLWAGEMSAARDLWMFWTDADTDTGMRRSFRFVELPPCPAVMRTLATDEREVCVLFDRHSAPHSWDVTDPLADLMAERMRQEVERERGGGGEGADGDGEGAEGDGEGDADGGGAGVTPSG